MGLCLYIKRALWRNQKNISQIAQLCAALKTGLNQSCFIPRGCSWHADLPTNTSSTLIFRCDSFSVGRGQESGRCWGDSVSIHSPNNDTLKLCGKRDGIHLTLEGYTESLEIVFESENNSLTHGFSCLLYTQQEVSADEEEKDFDCKLFWSILAKQNGLKKVLGHLWQNVFGEMGLIR